MKQKAAKFTLLFLALFNFGHLPAKQYSVLPAVTVSSTYVTFNNPSWYTPDFLSTAASGMSGGGGIGAGAAMMDAKERAWDLSNVCIGAISPGARQTTHQSDTTGRWLAAQEVFNIIQQKNCGRAMALQ